MASSHNTSAFILVNSHELSRDRWNRSLVGGHYRKSGVSGGGLIFALNSVLLRAPSCGRCHFWDSKLPFFFGDCQDFEDVYACSGSTATQIITDPTAVDWELRSLSTSHCWSLISHTVSAVISLSSHRAANCWVVLITIWQPPAQPGLELVAQLQ